MNRYEVRQAEKSIWLEGKTVTSSDYPRLCGGTFFTLVLQDVKQRISAREHYKGESDGLNDPDILIGLITVINPDYVRPQKSLKTKTNDYKSCKHSKGQYLPFGNTPEINEFDKRVKEDYSTALNDMTKFVEEYLEVGSSGKREYRLVKALLDLIQQDDTITDGDNDSMYVLPNGDALKKSQILELQEIHLPAFLLGVWHYCSTKRKNNKVGENTYNEWCPQKGGASRDYEGHMGETWKNQIKLVGVNQDGMYIANQDDGLCIDDEVEAESTPEIVQEDKRYFDINSLGKNDKELLREFRNDYKKVMRFCIYQDPTAEPTPLSLADEIENLYSEKWRFEYLEIENAGLRQLVKEILITFNDYLVYLSDIYLRLMPDGKRLIFRNQSWEEGGRLRDDMQPNTYKIRCRIAQLQEQLYPTVEETTPEPEVIVEEVVEEKVLQQTVNNPYVFHFTQNGDNNTQIGHVENYYASKKEE